MRAISLAYHDVANDAPAASSDVRPAAAFYAVPRHRFREHLRCIADHRSSVDVISGFRLWRNQSPTFLTFDDGAANALCAAAELEKRGWRGHFFVTTNWIGRSGFLNRQQIRELRQRGHVVGSHSCSHPARMSRLTWNELRKEWSDSCAILSDILGEPVKVASVPNGFYSTSVGQAAAASGLAVLFTSDATSVSHVLDGCLILGRYLIRWYTSADEAGAIAAGRLWPRYKQTLSWESKKVFKSLMGESYFTVRRRLLKLGSQPKDQNQPHPSSVIGV